MPQTRRRFVSSGSLAAELLGWGALLEDWNLASFTCIRGLRSAHCQLRKSWGVAKGIESTLWKLHKAPTPAEWVLT